MVLKFLKKMLQKDVTIIREDARSSKETRLFAFKSLQGPSNRVVHFGHIDINLVDLPVEESIHKVLAGGFKYAKLFKLGNTCFYSSLRYLSEHREVQRYSDNCGSSTEVFIYPETLLGSVVTNDGSFRIETISTNSIEGRRSDPNNGMCGQYCHETYYSSNKIYAVCHGEGFSVRPDSSLRRMAKLAVDSSQSKKTKQTLESLANNWIDIESFNKDFQYFYRTPEGEKDYLSVLPVQYFSNGTRLFTAYELHHLRDCVERRIKFFSTLDKEFFTLIQRQSHSAPNRPIRMLSIDNEASQLISSSTASLFGTVSEIKGGSRFLNFLDKYIFSDPQKRIINRIKDLDSYAFQNNRLVKEYNIKPAQKEECATFGEFLCFLDKYTSSDLQKGIINQIEERRGLNKRLKELDGKMPPTAKRQNAKREAVAKFRKKFPKRTR